MTKGPNTVKQPAKEIRRSATRKEPVETELATNQRIIARVTDGIYREPWAAFRELVANAYDADATSVVIETGAPDFEQITVRDNGNGMSPEALAYMLRNIGGSSKRTTVGEELQTVKEGAADCSPGGRLLSAQKGTWERMEDGAWRKAGRYPPSSFVDASMAHIASWCSLHPPYYQSGLRLLEEAKNHLMVTPVRGNGRGNAVLIRLKMLEGEIIFDEVAGQSSWGARLVWFAALKRDIVDADTN